MAIDIQQLKDYANAIAEGQKQAPNENLYRPVPSFPYQPMYPIYPMYPAPCPGCGRCPYCGRRGGYFYRPDEVTITCNS